MNAEGSQVYADSDTQPTKRGEVQEHLSALVEIQMHLHLISMEIGELFFIFSFPLQSVFDPESLGEGWRGKPRSECMWIVRLGQSRG